MKYLRFYGALVLFIASIAALCHVIWNHCIMLKLPTVQYMSYVLSLMFLGSLGAIAIATSLDPHKNGKEPEYEQIEEPVYRIKK